MDEIAHEALPDDYAICIAGHGSRDKEGIQEFLTLSSKFKEREPGRIVECGFLEFAKPTIDDAIVKCVQDGIKNIVVIPGVLMAAGHAKNDMPSEVLSMARKFPDLNIQYGRPLDIHRAAARSHPTRREPRCPVGRRRGPSAQTEPPSVRHLDGRTRLARVMSRRAHDLLEP